MIKNMIKMMNMAMAMVSENDWDEFRDQVEKTLEDLNHLTGKHYSILRSRVVYEDVDGYHDAYVNC